VIANHNVTDYFWTMPKVFTNKIQSLDGPSAMSIFKKWVLAAVVGLAVVGFGCIVDLPGLFGASDGDAEKVDNGGIEMVANLGPDGWHVVFVGILGRPRRVVVRVGDGPEQTRRMPVFTMPVGQGATEVHLVEYELNGTKYGPFTFQFDPEKAQLEAAKDALDLLDNRWVSWRRLEGEDTVNFVTILQHACALRTVEYGFGGKPDREMEFSCGWNHVDDFGASIVTLELNEAEHIVVQVTFADGTTTGVMRFENPNAGSLAWDSRDRSGGARLERERFLAAVAEQCTGGSKLSACRRAANRPGLPAGSIMPVPAVKSFSTVDFCETDKFAWARVVAEHEGDARTNLLVAILKPDAGGLALGRVLEYELIPDDDVTFPFASCADQPPLHRVGTARRLLLPLQVSWERREDGAVRARLPELAPWGCAIDRVEFRLPGVEKASPPTAVVRPECWLKKGWSDDVDQAVPTFTMDDPDGPGVRLKVVFEDDSSSESVSRNPYSSAPVVEVQVPHG